jgi:hypothetical protein
VNHAGIASIACTSLVTCSWMCLACSSSDSRVPVAAGNSAATRVSMPCRIISQPPVAELIERSLSCQVADAELGAEIGHRRQFLARGVATRGDQVPDDIGNLLILGLWIIPRHSFTHVRNTRLAFQGENSGHDEIIWGF